MVADGDIRRSRDQLEGRGRAAAGVAAGLLVLSAKTRMPARGGGGGLGP